MDKTLLSIDSALEKEKIISFIKTVLKKQGFKNAIIGLSGGIDSAVSLSLLTKSIAPKNVFVAHLYYFSSQIDSIKFFLKNLNIPTENIYNLCIKDPVDEIEKTVGLTKTAKDYRIRLGNIMARIRMIALYDLAKKHQALVCGTENKSEFYLGYFTRFGDEASDFEPIRHLYKTQVCQLAKYLGVSEKIIKQKPTPGLWVGHTAEAELGFSYKEADKVLSLYFDKKIDIEEIKKAGFANAQKIIDWALKNSFKHRLPYLIR